MSTLDTLLMVALGVLAVSMIGTALSMRRRERAARVQSATQERRRLAREMHDTVAQDIASLRYLVDSLEPHTPREIERIEQLRERIGDCVTEVRTSLATLRATAEDAPSLGAALRQVTDRLTSISSTPITVTAREGTARLRAHIESELFRIAQEAISNAVKHAGTLPVDVDCFVEAPLARIVVVDHGPGLPPTPSGSPLGSHGLSIMHERAAGIGATLDLSPTPGGGLTVTVSTRK